MKFYFFLFINICLVSCQTFKSNEDDLNIQLTKTREWIWISEDSILREILQENDVLNESRIDIDFQKIANVEVLSIQSDIQVSRSLLKSFLTLTLGAFYRFDSEFLFTVKYLDGIRVDHKNFKSRISYELKAPMPPYFGLGGTIALISLSRYNTPEHLKEYCLPKETRTIYKILESDKESYCQEYKKFLRIAWKSVKPKIEKDIKSRKVNSL